MAGRPKDPKIDKKIFNEIEKMLESKHYDEITIDQLSENTSVSKATIYRRWKDKSSIIIDMFVSQTQSVSIQQDSLYETLFAFASKVMSIYKTNLGKAVIEILVSTKQTDAKALFMKGYFESNRNIFKDMIRDYIKEDEQDLFIDLIFSPIYFNIILKPEVLNENYIEKLLHLLLKAYEINESNNG